MTTQYYHFSVDDVLDCLLDVSRCPHSFFENSVFNFLRRLQQEYAAIVDLYLFLRRSGLQGSGLQGSGSLCDVSSQLLPIITAERWLRFGPHALERETPPYTQSLDEQRAFCEQTYAQIARFAGSQNNSVWLRLHYFSECYELAPDLRRVGVDTLLTTDKPAISYRLPPEQVQQLCQTGTTQFNGIDFKRSHIRIEDLVGLYRDDKQLDQELDRRVAGAKCAVVFTHEYELIRPEVREMTLRVFAWMRRRRLSHIDTRPLGA